MDIQITPEPSEEERRAILAALAGEPEDEVEPASPWVAALLPQRGDDLAGP